jgi:hypothetical protein
MKSGPVDYRITYTTLIILLACAKLPLASFTVRIMIWRPLLNLDGFTEKDCLKIGCPWCLNTNGIRKTLASFPNSRSMSQNILSLHCPCTEKGSLGSSSFSCFGYEASPHGGFPCKIIISDKRRSLSSWIHSSISCHFSISYFITSLDQRSNHFLQTHPSLNRG